MASILRPFLLGSATVLTIADVGTQSCSEGSEEATLLQMKPAHIRSDAGLRPAKDKATLLQVGSDSPNGARAYIGCFKDFVNRDMGEMIGTSGDAATNRFPGCRAACAAAGNAYMALQSGGQCFCADSYANEERNEQVPDSECNPQPDHETTPYFGGGWRNAVYATDAGISSYVGCFKDFVNRDMGEMIGTSGDAATNRVPGCRAACAAAGNRYMALQSGGQCFCADSYANEERNEQVPDSECNPQPDHETTPYFGGSWRNAVYDITGYTPYIGCFKDFVNRDMGEMIGTSGDAATNRLPGCRAACAAAGNRYMALQSGGQCFCADSYANEERNEQVPDSECNPQPDHETTPYFGGSWRNAVYETGRR